MPTENHTEEMVVRLLRARGLIFLILGCAILQLILWVNVKDLIQYGILIFIDVLLFIGSFLSLLTIRNIKSTSVSSLSQGNLVCKHCGTKFDKRYIWKMHEKSCTKMKI